jgi:hypothetical protein
LVSSNSSCNKHTVFTFTYKYFRCHKF